MILFWNLVVSVAAILVDASLKGAVLMVVAAIVALIMVRSSPARRHAVWTATAPVSRDLAGDDKTGDNKTLSDDDLVRLQGKGHLVGSPEGSFFAYVEAAGKKFAVHICDSTTRKLVELKIVAGPVERMKFLKKGVVVVDGDGKERLSVPFDERANVRQHPVTGITARLAIVGHSQVRQGEVVALDIFVRNTTDREQTCHLRPTPEWRWTVNDGVITFDAIQRPIRRTDGFITTVELKPGEEKRVLRKRVRLLIQPAGWNDAETQYNVDVLPLSRGKYKLKASDISAALPAVNVMGFAPALLSAEAVDLAVIKLDEARAPTTRRTVTADLVTIAWGKPQRGLQAGVAWATDDVNDNEMDSKEVFIRNTADRELTFEFVQPAFGGLRQFRIDKNEPPGKDRGPRGFAAYRTVTLKPGETTLIATPTPPGVLRATGNIGSGVVGVEVEVWFPDRNEPTQSVLLRTGTMNLAKPSGFAHAISDEELQKKIELYTNWPRMQGPQTKAQQRALIKELEP